VRLLDKGVTCPTNCASCDSEYEDSIHVFFSCLFAIQVWNRTVLWGSIQHALSTTMSASEVIFSLLQNLSVDLSQRLTTAIWSIWKHCNLRVWDDVTETSATLWSELETWLLTGKQQTTLMPLKQISLICPLSSSVGSLPLQLYTSEVIGNLLCQAGISATLMLLSLVPLIEYVLVFASGSQMAALCWQKL